MNFKECSRDTVTLNDGAWGTELQKQGLQLGACPDEWNLTNTEAVRRVAESYLEAGSRIILTNTFRANPISLAQYGLASQCDAINGAGANISLAAANNSALVFASMGPSGKSLQTKELPPSNSRRPFRGKPTLWRPRVLMPC